MADCSCCKKKLMTTNCPICKKPICSFCSDKHKQEHANKKMYDDKSAPKEKK
jgi:hypothetical protein